MLVTEHSGTAAAEMIAAASPAHFYSCVQQIEASISARSLDLLRTRNWEGPLTDEDWLLAEELVCDQVPVLSTFRHQQPLYRLAIRGYCPEEILFHVQGDLLCICGYAKRAEGQPKMFYVRLHLPALAPGCRCAAWLTASVLKVSFTRDYSAPVFPSPVSPAVMPGKRMGYATAV